MRTTDGGVTPGHMSPEKLAIAYVDRMKEKRVYFTKLTRGLGIATLVGIGAGLGGSSAAPVVAEYVLVGGSVVGLISLLSASIDILSGPLDNRELRAMYRRRLRVEYRRANRHS